jgi:hypothetical protein
VSKPGRAPRDGQVEEDSQAAVCESEMLVYLEEQAARLRTAKDWRCGAVLGAAVEAYACLRFQHVQRSVLDDRTRTAFTGKAFRGKSKVNRVRPAF